MLRKKWKELGFIKRASIVVLAVLSICLQVSFAVTVNEAVPLKVAEGGTYNDGTICLLFKGATCNTTLHCRIIHPNGTVDKIDLKDSDYNYTIPQSNFCYPNSSTSTSNKREFRESIEQYLHRRHDVKTTCSENESYPTPTSHSEECTTTSSSQYSEECTTTSSSQYSEECTTTSSSQYSTTTSSPQYSEECTTTSSSQYSEECTTTSSSQHSTTTGSPQYSEECTTTSSSQYSEECTATSSSQHDDDDEECTFQYSEECTTTSSSQHTLTCHHSHKHHSSHHKHEHHSSASVPCGGAVTHTKGGGTFTHAPHKTKKTTRTGTETITGTETGTGKGTGTGTETITGKGTETITGTETGTGKGTETKTGKGTKTRTGTGVGPSTGTGAGPSGTETRVGPTPTGTGVGPSGTETGVGPTPTGTGVGPSGTETGVGPSTGTGAGPSGTETGVGPTPTGTGVGPSGTETRVGPTPTGTGVGPSGTETGVGPTPTGTGVGPSGTETGVGPTPTGTGAGPSGTETGVGPTPTGTGVGPSGTGTGSGPTPTGTGVGPSGTGTGVGPSGTETGVGPSGTETGVGPSGTGTGVGPSPTGTGVGPSETGTGVGPSPTGTGVGPSETGTGVGPSPTGTGVGPSGTGTGVGPSPTGTEVGPSGTGTGVGPTPTGTGPSPTGTEVGPSGTGTGVTGTGTGVTETGTATGTTGTGGTRTATGTVSSGLSSHPVTSTSSASVSKTTSPTTIPSEGVVIPNNQYSGEASAINIYAIQNNFILITYFPYFPTNYTVSGLIITWGGIVTSTIDFGKECTFSQIIKNVDEDGFLRVCFDETLHELDWTIYSSIDVNGNVAMNSSGAIKNFTEFSNLTESYNFTIFSIENHKYGVATTTYSNNNTWKLMIYWIDSETPTGGPYELYSLSDTSVIVFEIFQCTIARQSLGYSCLIYIERENSTQPSFLDIDFYYSGSINGTYNFNVSQIPNDQRPIGAEALDYGGFLILTESNTTIAGYATTNEGQNITSWGLSTDYTYLPITGISQENVVWAFVDQNSTTYENWTVVTSDSLSDYNKGAVGIYGTSTVVSTSPAINSTFIIPSDSMSFSITYTFTVITSSGYFRIYLIINGQKVLIFQAPANTGTVKGKTFYMDVPGGVISTPGGSYFAEADDGLVSDSNNSQDVPGIRSNTWLFTTSNATNNTVGGEVGVIILLTPEGTTSFLNQDRNLFVNNLQDGIANATGCSVDRISIPTKFQYKHDTSFGQIFLRVNFDQAQSPTEFDAPTLATFLDSLIKNKGTTLISMGSTTKYLDSDNGAWRITDLWKTYRWVLFALFGILILLLLWLWAFRKYRKGHNFLGFILWPLILVDFGLDIAFVAIHGEDEKWLYPTSIVFLVVPIAFCIIFTFWIVGEDLRDNNRFSQWWRQHSRVGLIFTILSGIDNESLNVMSSRSAGYRAFNAPFSRKAVTRIFYATVFIIIIEDFAQLIYLIIYQTVTIIPAIIPILTLITCILVILLRVICLILYSRDDDDYIDEDKSAVEEVTISTVQNDGGIVVNPVLDTYSEAERNTPYNLPPIDHGTHDNRILETEYSRQNIGYLPGGETTEEIRETEIIVPGGRRPMNIGSGYRVDNITNESVNIKNISSSHKVDEGTVVVHGVLPTTEASGSIETSVIREGPTVRRVIPTKEMSETTRVVNEGGLITKTTTTTDDNGVTTITTEYEGPSEIITSYEMPREGIREHFEGTGGRNVTHTTDTTTDTTTDATGTTTTTYTTTTTDTTTTDTTSRRGGKK